MQKMKNMYWNAVAKKHELASMLNDAMNKKVEGDSHFLAVAVAMIIVVVIGLLFKTQLTTLFGSVFTKTTTKVDGLF